MSGFCSLEFRLATAAYGKAYRGPPAQFVRCFDSCARRFLNTLVCAMHPAVLNFWMATADALEPHREAWLEQRRLIFGDVCGGAWWGTIASEPGASGDLTRSKASARPAVSGSEYGSGSKEFRKRIWDHFFHADGRGAGR
jgi:hypothetical protein